MRLKTASIGGRTPSAESLKMALSPSPPPLQKLNEPLLDEAVDANPPPLKWGNASSSIGKDFQLKLMIVQKWPSETCATDKLDHITENDMIAFQIALDSFILLKEKKQRYTKAKMPKMMKAVARRRRYEMMGRRTYRRVPCQQHRFGRKHYRVRQLNHEVLQGHHELNYSCS